MNRPRSSRPAPHCRPGASMIETAFVLGIFLTMTFGMFELSITAWYQHLVTQGARQLVRLAIVHGALAPPQLAEWSPATLGGATYSVAANGTGPVATAIQPSLAGLDITKTTITLQWIDGDAQSGSRVLAQVVTTHHSILSYVFNLTWTLTGKSTMPIVH